jgi:isopentenyl diphosphate isomerase/L-lactate dehydrogenase-like FMN-dependent dehydrogenase
MPRIGEHSIGGSSFPVCSSMQGNVTSRYDTLEYWLDDTDKLILDKTTIFGVTHPTPVFIGPVSSHHLMHSDAELGTARAASKVGVPLIISTAASRSMEEIADAQGPNGHRWFQLYW